MFQMRLSSKLFITIFALIIALVIVLFVSVQTTEEDFLLPTEGTQNFDIDLKRGWHYDLEVTRWSGDEIINISIMQGEEIIYSVLLEGEKLEYGGDPEVIEYPRLGESLQVEETEKYQLVIFIMTEGTSGSTQLRLIGTNQQVLGFDAIFLIIPILVALMCAIIALFGSFFYELYQKITQKEEVVIETEKRPLMEQCYYHNKSAIDQCEKCARFICTDCVMVFNNPFSGSLLAFTEDVEVTKHHYCPICYWKSVSEIASSWSMRFAHIFTLSILIFMLILFHITLFQPITTHFSTPLNTADWIILLFLLIFAIFIIGMSLLVVYSLLIDGPRRTTRAKIKRQEFLDETGIIEDDLN